jgi:hypothetical protein
MRKAITLALIIIILSPLIIQNHCSAILLSNPEFYSNEAKYLSSKLGSNIDFEKSFHTFNYEENLLEVIIESESSLNPNDLLTESNDIILLVKNENVDPYRKSEFDKETDETSFSPGEKVTLTAEPNPGFKFVNWTIDNKEVSKNRIYIMTMPLKDISIRANFVKDNMTVPNPSSSINFLDGLVAFYEMNSNSSGALRDSHGNNHGTSSQINHVDGFSDKGNKYDGKAGISRVPHHQSLNLSTEFTLMADVFRQGEGQANSSIIIGKTFSSSWTENQSYSMSITTDNRIRIRTNSPNLKDWISTQTVPLNKWVRIIATYKSGEGYSLYFNSTSPEKSPLLTGSIANSDQELTIGAASPQNNASNSRRFEGILDNVGIWNRQLSTSEIAELITAKITYPDFNFSQKAPSVLITSPSQNSQFIQGSSISITATAADTDGSIARVEFYRGTTLLGTDTTAPYSFAWTNLPVGSHSLTARATDNRGATTVSAPIIIQVVLIQKTNSGSGLLDGLVAFYELNTNTGGTLRDSHGQNHGTSTQINHVNGFNIKGNQYDGKSSISRVPHRGSLNLSTEFTLMADVYREGNGQNGSSIIIGKTFSSDWPENQVYSMAITNDNRIRIRTNSSSLRDWVSTQRIPLGKWVRIIATYKSGEGYSLYMNRIDPEKSPQLTGIITDSDQELTIGSASLLNNAANTRRFEGILDNVGIWNRQLSSAEIAELITAKITYPDFNPSQKAPSVLIISPSQNSQFIQGNSLTINSTAADTDGTITRVEFYRGTTLLGTDTTAPYSFAWTNLPVGAHSLTSRATDNRGATTVSAAVTINVTVRPNVAPSVSITGIIANAQFIQGSTLTINSTATDTDGTITRVEFYRGTTLLGTDTTAPYSFAWTNLPVGSHSLTARATDNRGVITVSAPIIIQVVLIQKTNSGLGLLDGLVAFYEMNTNTGGALRDSHGQNHGTSTQINHINGFNIKGNQYDGKSSISRVPHRGSLNLSTEFTLMADVYREGNGQNGSSIIIGKTFSSNWPENHVYSMAITSDNRIRIRTNSSSLRDWFSTQRIPLGKWVRIIATYKSGEGYSLYMDRIDPEKSPQLSGSITNSDQELTIGSAPLLNNAAHARRFEGILDNVGIWNRQLSKVEVTELISKKITYPDFKGNEGRRITTISILKESPEVPLSPIAITNAEPGEKLVFFVADEENMVFDHWSVEGVKVGSQMVLEVKMPNKDISLIKHYRSFIAPEIAIFLPGNKFEFVGLSEIDIEVAIKSNDATIKKVELFNGDDLVGELIQNSSKITWNNISDGNHRLVARITDNTGKYFFSDPIMVRVEDKISKENSNVRLNYVIGPNPTSDYLNLIFTNIDGKYDFEVRVVSMNGVVQKSFSVRTDESSLTIDVSDLKQGIYILQLTANGFEVSSKKFIKE